MIAKAKCQFDLYALINFDIYGFTERKRDVSIRENGTELRFKIVMEDYSLQAKLKDSM